MTQHVIPIGDSKPHVSRWTCRCRPYTVGDGVWVHNAYDGREFFEQEEEPQVARKYARKVALGLRVRAGQ